MSRSIAVKASKLKCVGTDAHSSNVDAFLSVGFHGMHAGPAGMIIPVCKQQP